MFISVSKEPTKYPVYFTKQIVSLVRQENNSHRFANDVKVITHNAPRNDTDDSLFRNNYTVCDGIGKIPENCSQAQSSFAIPISRKTTSKKKWSRFVSFLAGYLSLRAIGRRRRMSKVRYKYLDAQRSRGEGYSTGFNKRGDPCLVGKVAMEIKNKPSSSDPSRPPFAPLRTCSDGAGKHPSEKTSLPSGL